MLSSVNRSARSAEAMQISVQLLLLNLMFVAINRLIESLLLFRMHHLQGMYGDAFSGLLFDVAMVCLFSVFFFMLILIMPPGRRKTAIGAVSMISFLFHVSHQPIAYFFVATLTPLDRLLFTHSWREIMTTVSTAGINFLLVFLFLVIYSFAFWITAKRVFKYNYFYRFHKYIAVIVTLLAVLFVVIRPGHMNPSSFHSGDIIRNKPLIFYKDALSYFYFRLIKPPVHGNVIENTAHYQQLFDQHEYVSEKHAFLNKRKQSNPWGAFFSETNAPPSVFMIFVEGLGNDFLLPQDGVMLMPFLDSLKNESLYYDHFLGTGEGSYAVLPSMIGSLPHGVRGFTLLDDMPLHLNLINLLRPHGYSSGFYYGQGGYFHEKEKYLRRNMIDRFVEKNDYDDDYFRIYDPHSDYHWGFHDQDLFSNYLRNYLHDQDCRKLEIFFTGSMHSPFIIERDEHYDRRYDTVIANADISPERRAYYRNYHRYLRTLLFTDDALRLFFEEVSQRPCFEQSIFIITGDHPMRELPSGNALKKYHVPLIVYAPMLKESRRISSVTSQFDVMPALLNLLEQNYGLSIGRYSHMFGLPADTTTGFKANNTIPLMRGNRHLDEMVHRNYFLSQNQLYEIHEGLDIVPVNDAEMFNHLQEMLQAYQRVNNDVVRTANMLPGATFLDHTGMKVIIDTLIQGRFAIESFQEYYNLGSSKLTLSPGQQIVIHIRGETAGRRRNILPMMVFDLRTPDGQQVHWESIHPHQKDKPRHLAAPKFFNHFMVLQTEPEAGVEYELFAYFWNNEKVSAGFDKLELKIFATNPASLGLNQ